MKGPPPALNFHRKGFPIHALKQWKDKAAMWSDLSNAPKDGTPFLALNHDKEVWVARYDQDGRIQFRWNGRHEPRRFEARQIDGEIWLKEDKQFAKDHEKWVSQWTIWSRLYEFKPTHFIPLPMPPETL